MSASYCRWQLTQKIRKRFYASTVVNNHRRQRLRHMRTRLNFVSVWCFNCETAETNQGFNILSFSSLSVLTPADYTHHIDKHPFKIPFVCGARNLGEALRRIDEGAAMIRTKGEAGTGLKTFYFLPLVVLAVRGSWVTSSLRLTISQVTLRRRCAMRVKSTAR